MTSRAVVAAWTRRIAVVAGLCSLGVGAAVAGLARVVAGWLGASPATGTLFAIVAGLVAAALEGWRRLGGALTPARVSLWLEETVPALQYALVSALEGGEAAPWCDARVRRVDVATPSWRALRRALAWPVLASALGVAAFVAAPRLRHLPAAASRLARERAAPTSALSAIRARIVPPSYSRLPVDEIEQPNVLHPLVGSSVELNGPLPGALTTRDVTVVVDGAAHPARAGDGRWRVALAADTGTHVVRITQGGRSRLVVLEARVDSIPVVSIEQPQRDTVLREPRGTFLLRARAADDLGLVTAAFEYIVSSGEGERFTFRTGTLGAVRPTGNSVDLAATFDVTALRLAPGDVVHLRAVAHDANAVGGPGVGTSDTRTIRVARAGEQDSVAVDPAAPPEADKSIISQRMLINLTEALVRRLGVLDQASVVSESRRIARDQARLRRQVSDLVFARLGDDVTGEHFHGDGHAHGENEPLKRNLTPEEVLTAAERATGTGQGLDEAKDETPVVAINRPLLEAYNAMWDAGRELDIGRPRAALPPMYAALAAIQKARAAERLYLRGTPPRVVVDVGRARLQGRERGAGALLTRQEPPSAVHRVAMQRLQRALHVVPASAAADSLLLVRVSMVGTLREAARAMDALIADVRAGRDATASAALVRRALDVRARRADSVSLWEGVR